jgi:hypothetical protein
MYRRSLPPLLGLLFLAACSQAQPPAGKPALKGVGKEKKVAPKADLIEPTTRDLFRWLDESLDMRDFQGAMSLKEVLKKFADRFAAKGKELPIYVDKDAFEHEAAEAPDIYETPVKFPLTPRRRKLGEALQFALSKIATGNGTFLVRRGLIEVTTTEQASPAVLLQSKVRPNFEKRPLAEALDELSDKTGATILLDPRLGEKARSLITANFRSDISLDIAVKVLAETAGLHAQVYEDSFLLITSSPREGKQEKRSRLRLHERPLSLALQELSKWSGTRIILDPRAGEETIRIGGMPTGLPAIHTRADYPVSGTFWPGGSVLRAARALATQAELEPVTLDGAIFVTTPDVAERFRPGLQGAKSAGALAPR